MTGFFFFFRAVNNTFLQIPQLRKHKCEKETTARATERENKNKDGHRCACTPRQGLS